MKKIMLVISVVALAFYFLSCTRVGLTKKSNARFEEGNLVVDIFNFEISNPHEKEKKEE